MGIANDPLIPLDCIAVLA